MSNRMVFYAIFAMVLAVGFCPKFHGVDPELQPYFEEVAELSNGNLDGISRAGFNDDSPKVLGRCWPIWSEISINKKRWTNLDHRGRILLIAHEVAHCRCGTNHINRVDVWGCGEHFMHHQSSGRWCDEINWEKYLEQMRTIYCEG